MLEIINITFIVINYKRITSIMIHIGKKRLLPRTHSIANMLNIERYVLYNIQVELETHVCTTCSISITMYQ